MWTISAAMLQFPMPGPVAPSSSVSRSLRQQRPLAGSLQTEAVNCRYMLGKFHSTEGISLQFGRRAERTRGLVPCFPCCSSALVEETCKEKNLTHYCKWSNQRRLPLKYMLGGRAVAIILAIVQTIIPVHLNGVFASFNDGFISPAEAVLNSPNTKVPRSAEVALRRAIPAVNPTMKTIQESLEDIFYLLRIPQRKPYGSMEGDVKKALKFAKDEKPSILAALPASQQEQGEKIYAALTDGPGGLAALLDSISAKDPDKISMKLASSLDTVARLELLQATGLPFLLPADYQQYPRLTGRATIELIVEKGDGSTFTVPTGGGPQKSGKLEVILDGYSAPLTTGNFANLVLKGAYDGVKLRSTEQAILSDNELNSNGTSLPIEILPAGEFQPLYRTTLNVQDGELPVLPLSVYGAVAMAHNPSSEDFSASSQFFIYLYDKRSAGLGGLSFDEGQFSVFGYVVSGKELLSQLRTGDIIRSAKLTSGADRLIFPSNSS
ncbi:hypothetical protein O6H91_14G036100 [Diphasiastrum complanatum]|uniref:Uncharacterized protein n=1 Tax=Diphasiastrum complanatum TaxID=34168 RepID=A0ACC2BN49_DIPCM|nr:hypothetical protein O6H91_14G036100 [Diphasiastrum complanatum]